MAGEIHKQPQLIGITQKIKLTVEKTKSPSDK